MKYIRQTSIAALLSSCLLASCTTPPAETTGVPQHPATVNAEPTRTLAGSWHNNNHEEGGATKRFIPNVKGDLLRGEACGFRATCGSYKITRIDSAKRSLSLIISIPENEDQGSETILAEVSFDSAGKHMTLTRSGGKPVVFYRVK